MHELIYEANFLSLNVFISNSNIMNLNEKHQIAIIYFTVRLKEENSYINQLQIVMIYLFFLY